MKITRPRDGRHKHNLPKGGTDGELYGRHENNCPVDERHKNNSPKGYMDGELDGWARK